MKDLELKMRLTATDQNVAGTVRNTKKEVQGLSGTLDGASRAGRGTSSSMAGITTAGDEANRMFRVQKGALQQAGYQFQDLAVQIGGGTSAFVAIGQQGSQLLSVLGPGGALLGAVLAIGSVVGGTLVRSFGDGESAADKLAGTLDYLDTVMESTGSGAFELTERIRELYQVSQTAADLEVRRALVEAASAFDSAAESLQDTINDRFDTTILGDIEPAISQAARLARLGIDVADAFDQFGSSRGASFREGINLIRDEAENLSDEFGITTESARGLIGAIGAAQFDPTAESMRALQQALFDAQDSSEAVGSEFTILSSRLANIAQSAVDASERGETLKKWAEDLKAEFESTDPAARELQEALDGLISGLEGEYLALSLTDKQLLEHRLNVSGATDDERLRALGLFDTIKALEDKAEAENKAKRLTKEAADAEDRAKEALERRAQALLDQADPLAKFAKDWQVVQEALAADFLDESQAKKIMDNLIDVGQDAGKKAAEKFVNPFEQAAGQVSQAVQQAIASGDWDNLGDAIGNTLAASVSAVIGDQITKSLSDGLTDESGALAQAGAAFAGPLAGAVVGGAIQLAMREVEDYLSGGDWDPTEARQKAQGTGTVLGDINAKSESIRRAVEGTESGIGQLVGINQSMLQALKGVQLGIEGALTQINKRLELPEAYQGSTLTNQTQATGVGALATFTGLGPALAATLLPDNLAEVIDDLFGGAVEFFDKITLGAFSALGSAIGGKSKKVDEGIKLVGGSFADMADASVGSINDALVQAYVQTKSKKNFLDDYDPDSPIFADVDSQVNTQFRLVFERIGDAVGAGAEILGYSIGQIDAAFAGFTVPEQLISLENLSVEEQSKALDDVFSVIFDDLAANTVSWIGDFQDAGEGLGETLARVANQVAVTEEVVARLGIQFSDLSGEDLAIASARLVDFSGGIEKLISDMQGFTANFASDAQKFELAQSDITRALKQAELQLPETRQGYYDLLKAQDGATASGAENIATLLRLQSVADSYYGHLEDIANDAAATAEQAAAMLGASTDSALNALRESVREQKATLADAYRDQEAVIREEMDARLNANKIALDAAKSGLQAIEQEVRGLRSTLDQLRGSYEPITALRRESALETLRSALTTGDLTGTAAAAGLAGQINAQDYASKFEYERAQGQTIALLAALETDGTEQLTVAEQSIAALEAQTDLIRRSGRMALEQAEQAYQEEIDALDQIVTGAEDRLNALRGIETGVLSIVDAIRELGTALGQEVLGNSSSSDMGTVEQLYQTLLGREIGNEGQEYWSGMLKSGATLADVEWAIRQSPEYKKQIDGSHAAGLGNVPFDGYRAELHQSEMVLPAGVANHIRSSMRGSGQQSFQPVITAIEKLEDRLAVIEAYQRQTTKNTAQSAKYQQRMDRDGIRTREVVV